MTFLVKKEVSNTIFELKPIGNVHVEGEDPYSADYFVHINEPFRQGLKELDQFSHVFIIWWAHKNDTEELRNLSSWKIKPPYGENPPQTGIFATRAEYRPNPIGITVTKIISADVEAGKIQVEGLDAIDETPVLDLKAYFPISDRIRDCHIAPWLKDWPMWQEDGAAWWAEQNFFEE